MGGAEVLNRHDPLRIDDLAHNSFGLMNDDVFFFFFKKYYKITQLFIILK